MNNPLIPFSSLLESNRLADISPQYLKYILVKLIIPANAMEILFGAVTLSLFAAFTLRTG